MRGEPFTSKTSKHFINKIMQVRDVQTLRHPDISYKNKLVNKLGLQGLLSLAKNQDSEKALKKN